MDQIQKDPMNETKKRSLLFHSSKVYFYIAIVLILVVNGYLLLAAKKEYWPFDIYRTGQVLPFLKSKKATPPANSQFPPLNYPTPSQP